MHPLNFCSDVFWYCCLEVNQPSVTLEDFLNIHKHDLYHLKVGPRTCCQCPPGYISTVTNAQLGQADWTSLFRRSGQPCNLPYHVYDSCCSVAEWSRGRLSRSSSASLASFSLLHTFATCKIAFLMSEAAD
jgi:hypothetical protein